MLHFDIDHVVIIDSKLGTSANINIIDSKLGAIINMRVLVAYLLLSIQLT